MSEAIERRGQCMCGAVTLTARTPATQFGACHCTMCRKWCSGPLMALDCGSDVSITGEDSVTVFNSSEWAERAFCNKCGSALFYRLKQNNEHIVAVGLFEKDADLSFSNQVFVDEKPAYYNFAEDTKNLTGPELFAMYGAE